MYSIIPHPRPEFQNKYTVKVRTEKGIAFFYGAVRSFRLEEKAKPFYCKSVFDTVMQARAFINDLMEARSKVYDLT